MIIGITGSFGAGKGTVVEYLVQKKGFKHYSASGFITEEIVRRGMPVNRDSMILVSNEMRAQNGPSYIIDSLYDRAKQAGGDAILESLRAVAEVHRIKELGGKVIGVDAEPHLRYERSVARKSEKDDVSYEKWLAQEQEESNTTDPTKQNIFGALKESDYTVTNNGTLEELHAQIDALPIFN
ncbi:MAG: AAA family ATPase [Candidatus Pacebacteria bacterium]|nr:AAA family ATPase [Candidatus Paceibacterota bacterium]